MKKLVLLLLFLFPVLLIGQSRSGGYGTPGMYWKRYKHLVPVVNELTWPTVPTVGNVLSDIMYPEERIQPEKTVDQYYKEFLTLPEEKQIEMKNILHETWDLERYKNSQSAVYATYMEIKNKKDDADK